MAGEAPTIVASPASASRARASASSSCSAFLSARPRTRMTELVDVERLGQIVVGAPLQGGDRVVRVGVRGHEDEGGARRDVVSLLKQRQAAHTGKPDVAHHNVERRRDELLERHLTVGVPVHGIIG